jgi:hypothetical protein
MQTVQRLIASTWLAILANVVAHFALGMGWYGVFSAQWLEAIDATKRGFDPTTAPPIIYLTSIVSVVLGSLFVAGLMDRAGERNLSGGVKWSLLLWAGVALPMLLMHYAFAGNPLSLVLIDGGYELVGLALTGIVLGALGFRTRGVARTAVSPAAA